MSDVLTRRGRQSRRRGADAERAVRDLYRTGGWQAFKVSDSAVVDVVAMRMYGLTQLGSAFSEVLFIEVKRTAKPFAHFLPAERAALIAAAELAGATPLLFWWPKGKAIGDAEVIPASEWPTTIEKETT